MIWYDDDYAGVAIMSQCITCEDSTDLSINLYLGNIWPLL